MKKVMIVAGEFSAELERCPRMAKNAVVCIGCNHNAATRDPDAHVYSRGDLVSDIPILGYSPNCEHPALAEKRTKKIKVIDATVRQLAAHFRGATEVAIGDKEGRRFFDINAEIEVEEGP